MILVGERPMRVEAPARAGCGPHGSDHAGMSNEKEG